MTKAGVCYAILECINTRVIIPKKIYCERIFISKGHYSEKFYLEELLFRRSFCSEGLLFWIQNNDFEIKIFGIMTIYRNKNLLEYDPSEYRTVPTAESDRDFSSFIL